MTRLPFPNDAEVDANPGYRQSWHSSVPSDPEPKPRRRYQVPITMGRTSTVEHGKLDDNSELTYTQGQCHAFALALHHTHGWNLGVVQDPEDGVPTHWYAEHPSGAIADINGLHDPNEFARKWNAAPPNGEPVGRRGGLHPSQGDGLRRDWTIPSVGNNVYPPGEEPRRATASNIHAAASRAMTRHMQVTPEDEEHPYYLESGDNDDLKSRNEFDVQLGNYVKPHMTAAKSLMNPWQKERAQHWQPELELEYKHRDVEHSPW